MEPPGRECPNRHIVNTGLIQGFLQSSVQLRLMLVDCQHPPVLMTQCKLNQAVLVGLKAGRMAQLPPELHIFRGGEGGQHLPGLDQLFLNPRNPCQHLESRLQVVFLDGSDGCLQLMENQLHPQFTHLVDDDKQHFIVVSRQTLLTVQDPVQMKIVPVGHLLAEIRVNSLFRYSFSVIGHGFLPLLTPILQNTRQCFPEKENGAPEGVYILKSKNIRRVKLKNGVPRIQSERMRKRDQRITRFPLIHSPA